MLFAKLGAQHRLDDNLPVLVAHEQILSLADEIVERADNLLLAEVVEVGHGGRSIGQDAASNGREKKNIRKRASPRGARNLRRFRKVRRDNGWVKRPRTAPPASLPWLWWSTPKGQRPVRLSELLFRKEKERKDNRKNSTRLNKR